MRRRPNADELFEAAGSRLAPECAVAFIARIAEFAHFAQDEATVLRLRYRRHEAQSLVHAQWIGIVGIVQDDDAGGGVPTLESPRGEFDVEQCRIDRIVGPRAANGGERKRVVHRIMRTEQWQCDIVHHRAVAVVFESYAF